MEGPPPGIALPTDVLIIIIENLDLKDLINLSYTCKLMYAVVHEFGWSIFLRHHQRQSFTLHSARTRWSSHAQVRYNALSDRSWSRAKFIARPLSRPWPGKLQPILAVSFSRLLVAAGRIIYSYGIQDSFVEGCGTKLVFEGSYAFTLGRGLPERDITSIAFVPDAEQDRTVSLGFEDGYVEQHYLPPQDKPHNKQRITIERAPDSALHNHAGDVVESLSCSQSTLLSLSQWGAVSLGDLSSPSLSPTRVELSARSWTAHLCMSASTPYATFGTTSSTPLSLHYITPSGLSPSPSIALQSSKTRPSAVYGITSPPPSSPLGPSDQIIISGWYDGSVRIHDLRSSSRFSSPSPTHTLTALRPVLSLQDPWSPEPIYSVSSGGGSSSFVAAGTARHSVIAFWDVRHPQRGWSVHAPGNDSSPVYSVVLESSRVFGATQSRPFVYDFGPGVTRDTYPSAVSGGPHVAGRRGSAEDRLKLLGNGVGYQVTKYSHCRTGVL
ncbi:hypothetical protein HYDPIDRAFT_90416 [Hydnomerulius pinastri MD-312]|uniref:F-box domain-containing protein n=1 Tax=Hydnomerulius pinastri MD-312 TaxID=994086 RepID=A0A0C9WF75_9AGAM|nr:hypothetical protein HYDPIDRAFT_90416 [Hydnomerulius pinastri MD-312]